MGSVRHTEMERVTGPGSAKVRHQGHFTPAEHPLRMGRSTLVSAVTAACGLPGERPIGRTSSGSRRPSL